MATRFGVMAAVLALLTMALAVLAMVWAAGGALVWLGWNALVSDAPLTYAQSVAAFVLLTVAWRVVGPRPRRERE